MKEIIGLVVLVVLAVVFALWLKGHVDKLSGRKKESKKKADKPRLSPIRSERERTLVSPEPREVLDEVSSEPPTRSRGEENHLELFKDRLRGRKAVNASLASSLASAMAEFGDSVGTDDAVRAALQIGYPPVDVAAFMASKQYEPQEVATLLTDECSLGATELADLIIPIVKGDTVSARAEATFKVVKDTLDVDSDDDELIEVPAHLGCSSEDAAAIVYTNTDQLLGSVLVRMKLYASPDIAAGLAKRFDVDLSDDDEYKALREDDAVEFDGAATILKACGKDAETIIAAENNNNEFSIDEFAEIFPALSGAGFTNIEIMVGMSRAGFIDENAFASIVHEALERKVPMGDIVLFLKKEDVDPGDLDEELRELDLELITRVKVLYALLHAEEVPVAEEAAESEPNQ